MPTTTATTLRKGNATTVLDGPFAETKEQLLGFFIVECASLEQAITTAKELGQASSTSGSYEIRPLRLLRSRPSGRTWRVSIPCHDHDDDAPEWGTSLARVTAIDAVGDRDGEE